MGIFRRAAVKAEPRYFHPWMGSGGTYLPIYISYLDGIAAELSKPDWRVQVYFNTTLKCAEFHIPFEQLVARVAVVGEAGLPERMVVTPFCLSPEDRELFKRIPLRVVFEDSVARRVRT